MKKEMTLSEFKEFCKGRNEIRYISGWNMGTTAQLYEETMDFSLIAVSPEDRTIRMSGEGRSIKLYNVIEIESVVLNFGETEAKLTCRDEKRGRTSVSYIYFAP